jgi:hypothetical protein
MKKFFIILFLVLGFLFFQLKPTLGQQLQLPLIGPSEGWIAPNCNEFDNEINCRKECEKFLINDNYYKSQNDEVVCQKTPIYTKVARTALRFYFDHYLFIDIILLVLPIFVFIIHFRRNFRIYKLLYLIYAYFQIILWFLIIGWFIGSDPLIGIRSADHAPGNFDINISFSYSLVSVIVLLILNFLIIKFIFKLKLKSAIKYCILLTIWGLIFFAQPLLELGKSTYLY